MVSKPDINQECNTEICPISFSLSSGYGGYVSKTFILDVLPTSFYWSASGDDSSHTWVNGTKVLTTGPNCGGTIISRSIYVPISLLRIGENVVGFQVNNDCGGPSAGNGSATISFT